MKYNPSWFVFFFFSIYSILLTMSANNFFVFWLSFEMSVISFLPMITTSSSLFTDMMVKYYVIQALGSYLFLFSNMMMNSKTYYLFVMSLTLKLGLFPFMYWVPMIMSNISWPTCFFVSTLQKLNPLIVLLTSNKTDIIILVVGMSVFLSGMLVSNQNELRSLMAYSSISHTSFLIISGYISLFFFLLYFLVYFILSYMLFFIFKENNMTHMNNWKLMPSRNKCIMLLLFLAGIPPFPIFFMKMIIFFYIFTISPMMMIIIMVGSLMSMYFYMLLVTPVLIK